MLYYCQMLYYCHLLFDIITYQFILRLIAQSPSSKLAYFLNIKMPVQHTARALIDQPWELEAGSSMSKGQLVEPTCAMKPGSGRRKGQVVEPTWAMEAGNGIRKGK